MGGEGRKRGAGVERIARKKCGDRLGITHALGDSRPSSQLLVLGHYDTVYSTGTLARMPFRVEHSKAYGPGTFDMKSGIVQALFALLTIQRARIPLRKRLVFLWPSDEAIATESSPNFFETQPPPRAPLFTPLPS